MLSSGTWSSSSLVRKAGLMTLILATLWLSSTWEKYGNMHAQEKQSL